MQITQWTRPTKTKPAAIEEPGGNRRLDIQGLRAIAVLMVVGFHAGLPLPGGFVGVDVFFVISGFVITAMLHREWTATGRIQFGRFYIRRFKRLTPALALMIAVTTAVAILVLSPYEARHQQTAAKAAAGAMALAANIVIALTTRGYFDAPAEANPLLNTWSLSVEEQFYLAFPFILYSGWLLSKTNSVFRYSPHIFVSIVAIFSFFLALLGAAGFHPIMGSTLIGFYSPLTRAWEFAVGALLSLVIEAARPISPRMATMLGVGGLMMILASLWLIKGTTPFPGIWTLLPVAGAAFLLVAGTGAPNPITRGLAVPVMVKLGDWSYSIYLWHWPLIVFAILLWPGNHEARVIAVLVSLIPAIASYNFVERPVRKLSTQSPRRFVGLFALTMLPPLGLAGLLEIGAHKRWWITWPVAVSSKYQERIAVSRGCVDRPFDPDSCTWGDKRARGSVLLAGDSQAYAVADGVIEAASRLGMKTVVNSRSGCPLLTVDTTGSKPLDCHSWQQEVLSFALQTRPNVVIIANRSAGYTRPDLKWRTFIDENGAPATIGNASAIYEIGLDNVAKILANAGIKVVIFQNIPEPEKIEDYASLLRLVLPRMSRDTFDPALSISNRSHATYVETKVASLDKSAILYDPLPILCSSGQCPMRHRGASVYMDTNHLTRAGALLLAPSLEAVIAKASPP